MPRNSGIYVKVLHVKPNPSTVVEFSKSELLYEGFFWWEQLAKHDNFSG